MTSSQFRSKQIRNLISLYFFELIRNKGLDTSEVISSFEKQMEIENSDLSKILGEKYKILLSEFSKNSKIFMRYFSDLAEIVSGLIISSRVHYKLKAILFMRPIVVSFKKKE